MICPPDHKHGAKATCYCIHKCRCDDCRKAGAMRERRRSRDKAYGRYDTGLVDAGPVREHVRSLMEYGVGWERIATIAGVSRTQVRTLIYGREEYRDGAPGPRHGEMGKRVKRAFAESLLNVKPDLSLLGRTVPYPARGTHRRIQALMCNGWSMSKIGTLVGADQTSISRTLRQERTWAGRAREIADLYETLWDKSPLIETKHDLIAANRAKAYAKAHRFVPPLGWDDIDLDPEPPKPEPRLGTVGEREDMVRALHARRMGDRRIGEVVGVPSRTVLRIRQRLGLPAWTKEQQEAAA